MRTILFTLFALCSIISAAPEKELEPRLVQILTSLIDDVLLSENHQGSREFYGTPGDKAVILLSGGGFGKTPVSWPEGFTPKIEGYTFVLERPKPAETPLDIDEYQEWNSKHDKRLAIRLDKLELNAKANKEDKDLHPMFLCPIRISIQNGGGSKNGAVIGGKTTWYDIECSEKGVWSVVMKGAID